MALARNPEHYARTKYINIQYHFIREVLQDKLINIHYIPINDQIADGLTKPLDSTKFKLFIKGLGLISRAS